MSMGRYEIIYILAPNTPEDTMNDLVARFESEITDNGGVLLRVEKWGRKKLAYEVRKFREGFFVLYVTDCDGSVVTELERRFRMTDSVIKFMSVRIDEELKRAGKMPKDEELGKEVETERIDRSRRSTPKPPMRSEAPPARAEAEKAAEKPAEKPAEEPAEEKAAETPAEAPAEETTEAPAEEPAETPAEEPTEDK
jgi:small subunit ribosomal protein S6